MKLSKRVKHHFLVITANSMIERRIIDRNYTGGRAGQAPQFVVVHTYNGKGRSLFNWFNSQSAQVSAHYAIFLDGNGEQYVDESNTAWHCGNWDANTKSIGIEHQDNGNPNDSTRTDAMYETSAQLIADIYRRYGWDKKNKALIKPHKEFASTGCPAALNLDRIRNRVYDILNPAPLPVDNFYRVFKDGVQLNAYSLKDNAFNFWYHDKSRKVIFQNKDITSEFLTMATKLEEEITKLKEEVKNRDKTIENTLRELDNAKELNEIFQSRIRDLEAEIKQLKNPSGNNFNLL